MTMDPGQLTGSSWFAADLFQETGIILELGVLHGWWWFPPLNQCQHGGKWRNSWQAKHGLLGRATGMKWVGKGFKGRFCGNGLTTLLLNSCMKKPKTPGVFFFNRVQFLKDSQHTHAPKSWTWLEATARDWLSSTKEEPSVWRHRSTLQQRKFHDFHSGAEVWNVWEHEHLWE